jgi:hypothetical protein
MTIRARQLRQCQGFKIVALATLSLGAIAIVYADDVASPDVTVMEKVIVEATRSDEHSGLLGFLSRLNPWLYIAAPDYEILSRCDSEQTLAATRHLSDSLALDEDFVPADYLAPLATPMSFIMFNQKPSMAMDALIPNTIEASEDFDFGIYHLPTGFTAGGRDSSDSDTHCAVQNRWGMAWAWAGGSVGRGPIPTGLLFKIGKCTPALPTWYRFGFIGPCGLLRMVPGSNSMILAAATWVSMTDTDALLAATRKTGTLPVLPPIEGLFTRRSASGSNYLTDWPSPPWMAEAALFLRWGIYGGTSHRRAFEIFVERSRVEPVTEAMFRGCFGFGFAEMQVQMSRYLVEGAQKPVIVGYDSFAHWRPNNDPQHPPFSNLICREATRAEIARLLGDWERMEGNSNRLSDPALSRLYLKRAGITLNRCYDAGERDPRFLAVLGLYDADVGVEPEARNILEDATKVWVERPAAYVALAQLNFNEAKEHPAVAGGLLSTQQTAAVLRPLFAVRKKARLDGTGYLLIAEAWSRCVEKPSLSNLAALKEGMGLYPLDSALILSAAKVYAHWGYASEAGTIVDHGLKFADDATDRQLLELQTSLKSAN